MIKSTEDKDRSTEVSVEKFKKSKTLFYHSTEEKEWGTGKVFEKQWLKTCQSWQKTQIYKF